VDLKETVGLEYGMEKTISYDKEELVLFSYIVGLSILPIVVVWSLS
jgi:hypothetical protein